MSGPGRIHFRPARVSEAARLVDLIQAAYRGEGGRSGWTTEADLVRGRRISEEQLTALLAAPGSLMIVAEEAAGVVTGEPAGVVACCHLARVSDEAAHFGLFAVAPERQGSGLGRSLLAEVETLASRWGCRRIGLQVISRRPELIAWYERLGYRSTGETTPFPTDDPDDVPLAPGLEFLHMSKPLG